VALRAGRLAQPGRRRGGPVAAPHGKEVARGGTELSGASRGDAHSGDRRRRPGDRRSQLGVTSRGKGGRAAAARRVAVERRAMVAVARRVVAAT
jgi:hypothetical protein